MHLVIVCLVLFFFFSRKRFLAIKQLKYHTSKTDSLCVLMKHCPTEVTKFRLAYCHVISPNVTKYTTKLDKKIL